MPLMQQAMAGLATPFFQLIDNLFTSDEEREKAKLALLKLEQEGKLAQIAVNIQEASHENVFVAGWRPFIGWCCGAALAYHYILAPLFIFLVKLHTPDFPSETLPMLDITDLMALLGGMLGFGYMRTKEKEKGVNKNR